MRTKSFATAILVALVGTGFAFADGYTPYVTDKVKKTHTCEYSYKNAKGQPAKQTVVIYYDDKERNQWAYFYNADKKPWARCAIPGNKHYEPKKMYWEELQPAKDAYAPFIDPKTKMPQPVGYCPAPKDAPRNPIPDLPLPPK